MNIKLLFTVLFISCAISLFSNTLQAETTWHVDDDAPGDPGPGDPTVSDPLEDGSVDHPFDAIQEGIDAASSGDTVLVADGTYTGGGNRDLDFGGKAITVSSENGAEDCIIDCEGSSTDPHRGFYFHNSESVDSVVQGFTIRNGYAGGFSPQNCGAGILCDHASPMINSNAIIENVASLAGGGIYLLYSDPIITNNTISGNQTNIGGGINCLYSEPTITNNIISGNTGNQGGGICCYYHFDADPVIRDNIIDGNMSGDFGGGIYCRTSSPEISNNLIVNNSSSRYGGGIYCDTSNAEIKDNEISRNRAYDRGGGIYAAAGSSGPVIDGNTITGNSASFRGGGVHTSANTQTITNNVFNGNDGRWGGGIYSTAGSGTQTTLENNTIVNNYATYLGGGFYRDGVSVTIKNNIFWDNDAPAGKEICMEDSSYPQTFTISYSDVQGGWFSVYLGTGWSMNWSDGMKAADPLFVDGPHGDHYLSQIAAGQGTDSPCADGGDPASGIPDGTTRTDWAPDTGVLDMGRHFPIDIVANAGGPYSGEVGYDIAFDASRSGSPEGSIIGYRWDWTNDGTWDTGWLEGAVTVFSYTESFHGFARLEVIDEMDNTDTGYAVADLYVLPVADAGGPYTGLVDIPMTLDASNSYDPDGTIAVYRWDWTDDGTWDTNWLSNAVVTHSYDAPFNGQARVEVKDDEGATDTDTADVNVRYGPEADAGGPYISSAGVEVTFDASGSYHPGGGAITGYRWDWTGDGTWDTGWLSDPVTTHVYDEPFVGLANLEVKDSTLATDSDTADIDIDDGSPYADAGGSYFGDIGDEIAFDASGSSDRDGTVAGYRWDWTDDGTWDTDWLGEPAAAHTYHEEFYGQARLEIMDSDGKTDEDLADVSIGDTIFVDDDNTQGPWYGTMDHPYRKIQDGIDAASSGDLVLIADGTYTGDGNRDLDFHGKSITVRSQSGPDSCTIDGEGTHGHRGFYFHSGEGQDSVVQGLTIRGGYSYGAGGGIYCKNASPTISHNIIIDNESSSSYGGGIFCDGGSPMIVDNTITDNFLTGGWSYGGGIACLNASSTIKRNLISYNDCYDYGGGIFCNGSPPTITENVITGNHCELRGGGICCAGDPVITNNRISGNSTGIEANMGWGGGIYCLTGSPVIKNNIITGNGSHREGGGIYSQSATVTFSNNLLIGNTAAEYGDPYGGGYYGPGIIKNCIIKDNWPDQIYGAPDVTYSNVKGGYPGTGNFDADPLFVTGPLGGYYLAQKPAYQLRNSPCVNAGDPGSAMIEGTTRTDSVQDAGTIDVGYHYAVYYLSAYRVTPMVGTENTLFTYSVDVTMPEDETFEGVYVFIDEAYYAEMTLSSGTPGEGTYTYATTLEGAGYHEALFYLDTAEGFYVLPVNGMRSFHYPFVMEVDLKETPRLKPRTHWN